MWGKIYLYCNFSFDACIKIFSKPIAIFIDINIRTNGVPKNPRSWIELDSIVHVKTG